MNGSLAIIFSVTLITVFPSTYLDSMPSIATINTNTMVERMLTIVLIQNLSGTDILRKLRKNLLAGAPTWSSNRSTTMMVTPSGSNSIVPVINALRNFLSMA
jgi:low affinity Fe/Cu permease